MQLLLLSNPQSMLELLTVKASLGATEPPLRKQVPFLALVHTKWVQSKFSTQFVAQFCRKINVSESQFYPYPVIG